MYTEYQNTYTSIGDSFIGSSKVPRADPFLLNTPLNFKLADPVDSVEFSRQDLVRLTSFRSCEFEMKQPGEEKAMA